MHFPNINKLEKIVFTMLFLAKVYFIWFIFTHKYMLNELVNI